MEEFVQKFRRAARGSGYIGRLLVEELKRGINRIIQQNRKRERKRKKEDQ